MSGVVNVRRDVNDKYYRYKMPKLISKVEGKGNGIRTVIPNMSDIAKSLSRPSTYPTKFFGCELGAQVKCDEKNSKYVVNGSHQSEKLQELLDVFIEKFVLCPSCRNPETDLLVVNKNEILRKCKACGATLPVDIRHKLCTWIFKNPPKLDRTYLTVSTACSKKKGINGSKSNSSLKKSSGATESTIDKHQRNPEASSIINLSVGGSCLIDSADSFIENLSSDNDHYTDSAFDDSRDYEFEALSGSLSSKKTARLASGMEKLSLSANSASAPDNDEETLENFGMYLSDNPNLSYLEIVDRASNLRPDKVAAILPQVLFTSNMLENKEVEKYSLVIRNFTKTEKTQKAFLGGIERLVSLKVPSLLAKVPLIFKELYDHDIIEESTFLAWGESHGKKYVGRKTSKEIHSKAQTFLDWLQQAEEESSDEEE